MVDAGYSCHSMTKHPSTQGSSKYPSPKVGESHSGQAFCHSGFGFLWVFGYLGVSSFNGTPKHLTPVLKTLKLVPHRDTPSFALGFGACRSGRSGTGLPPRTVGRERLSPRNVGLQVFSLASRPAVSRCRRAIPTPAGRFRGLNHSRPTIEPLSIPLS